LLLSGASQAVLLEAERSGAGGSTARGEFAGGLVAEATVDSNCVVLDTPLFDEVPSFSQPREDFAVEKLVTKATVEGLDVGILPGGSWADEEGVGVDRIQPFSDRLRGKLWAVVGANELRHAALNHGAGKQADQIVGGDGPCWMEADAFAGVLIDKAKDLELPTIIGAVEDEIVGPNVALVLRLAPHARVA